MFAKFFLNPKDLRMPYLKMETIVTNAVSKYLLPGTRVKSPENHY
jgi:hypothetical protein